MKLKGRSAVITGANRGLGEAISTEFVKEGANVFICARDEEKLLNVKEKLSTFVGDNQKIYALATDVSKEDDVKRLIDTAIAKLKRIDILVNNAGIYGPKGPTDKMESNEWINAVQINLFSVFYCCKYVLPHMKINNYGKIINLSGGGATAPLPFISAYAVSKTGVVRFTETLAKECSEFNIDINAVAPGSLNTRMLDEVLFAGPEKVGQDFYIKALKQKRDGGVPLTAGAELCVYLASDDSDGISGRLISAKWDPWQSLSEHRQELSTSDIYTLRRIVPKDRGKEWVQA
jgi:3-oxoacyl-[acyl-carrier protein] reductase